jgi:hypothetical protein
VSVYNQQVQLDCYSLQDLIDHARQSQMNESDIHSIVWQACEYVLKRTLCPESILEEMTEGITAITDEIYACFLSNVNATPLVDKLRQVVCELSQRLNEIVSDAVHWDVTDLVINIDTVLSLSLRGWDDLMDKPYRHAN